MSLTFTQEKSQTDTKIIMVLVPKPSEWNTGDKVADLKLTRAATTLVSTLEKVEQSKSPKTLEIKLMAFIKFVRKYRELKIYDTLPRENVWLFMELTGKSVKLSRDTMSDIWDHTK